MEEWVGSLWDRWITRAAMREFPAAAVELRQIEKTLGVVFRGMGGDAGLRVSPALVERHRARRNWLERVAGSGDRVQHAGMDGEILRLPARIALFEDAGLNRDLYVWLAALAAHDVPTNEDWIVRNQRATVVALHHFPGLQARYERLQAACLAMRRPPEQMPVDEAAQERAVRAALTVPGSVSALPALSRPKAHPLQPVPLWLYPLPAHAQTTRSVQHQEAGGTVAPEEKQAAPYRAERTEAPDGEHGLLMVFRAESLFSWTEYVRVNRSVDDEPDPDAAQAAKTIDTLSVAQDGERVAAKVRFDLDLPAASEDDLPLGEGLRLPEWDYRSSHLRPDHCCVQLMVARAAEPCPLPPHLRRTARRLRNQLAVLAPQRCWLKGQPEGSELDLDACVRAEAERMAGVSQDGAGLYMAQVQQERDLACLILADLSLSTDAWAGGDNKVIDVIRDSLMLLAEALQATGDAFAMYGFSSLKRSNVRMHELKRFDTAYDAATRGRVAAIEPGYYTRMGAAIRQATRLLDQQPNAQRLLLILSDGKPHDLDLYEGRYGIEDTRKSVMEALDAGIKPFCVTIDKEGAAYLPHLFGPGGYTVVRKPADLPLQLPRLYTQLTA